MKLKLNKVKYLTQDLTHFSSRTFKRLPRLFHPKEKNIWWESSLCHGAWVLGLGCRAVVAVFGEWRERLNTDFESLSCLDGLSVSLGLLLLFGRGRWNRTLKEWAFTAWHQRVSNGKGGVLWYEALFLQPYLTKTQSKLIVLQTAASRTEMDTYFLLQSTNAIRRVSGWPF